MQANTYFEDSDAWRSEYAKFPNHESSLFCNLAAYSRAKSHRDIHLADDYWHALSMAGCPDWEANTRNGAYAFTDCFRFLKAGNPSRFQEIGPLIAFLLAADFHYAGAVCAPSVSVVGAIVHEINKGGVLGLEQLGLVSPRKLGAKGRPKKGDLEDIKAGFSRLFHFLDREALERLQGAHNSNSSFLPSPHLSIAKCLTSPFPLQNNIITATQPAQFFSINRPDITVTTNFKVTEDGGFTQAGDAELPDTAVEEEEEEH
ncbi:hypothetical protein B0H14DRAFT_3887990 [Mycena olivaceomarginata]|nr:hypothetical protein B0H14DRAFT_3887990 [Mycena olivaceomarginata]